MAPEVAGDVVEVRRHGSPSSAADGSLTVVPGDGTGPARVIASSRRPIRPTALPEQPAAGRRTSRPDASAFAVRDGETPWTAEELVGVENALNEEYRRLLREVATLEANLADMMRQSSDSAGDDHADTGSRAYGREQELAFLTTTRNLLLQTGHALGRIENGSYGDCEACREPIGKLRLEAFPRATLCVTCKQRQERH
jgi:DnaK suppressor protein